MESGEEKWPGDTVWFLIMQKNCAIHVLQNVTVYFCPYINQPFDAFCGVTFEQPFYLMCSWTEKTNVIKQGLFVRRYDVIRCRSRFSKHWPFIYLSILQRANKRSGLVFSFDKYSISIGFNAKANFWILILESIYFFCSLWIHVACTQ